MKIKLLMDIPVDPAFGLRAGLIVDAYPSSNPGLPQWFVKVKVGATVAPVGIMPHEAEEVDPCPADAEAVPF